MIQGLFLKEKARMGDEIYFQWPWISIFDNQTFFSFYKDNFELQKVHILSTVNP